MSLDWTPVALAIKAARDEMHLTQQQLAKLAGVSRTTIRHLEDPAREYETVPPSILKVGRTFGWPDPVDTARRITTGEAPPPVRPPGRTPVAAPAARHAQDRPWVEGMPLRVERDLRSGRLVDHTTIEVDGLKVVVLLMADADGAPTEGQMATGLAAWSDMERLARNLSTTDSDQENS